MPVLAQAFQNPALPLPCFVADHLTHTQGMGRWPHVLTDRQCHVDRRFFANYGKRIRAAIRSCFVIVGAGSQFRTRASHHW